MTMDLAGPMAVQARIAAIQGQLVQAGVLNVPSATAATGSSDFASVLAGLTSGANAGGTGGTALSGDQVVADARKYLGVPYVWGGTDPAKGLDCSGLVQRVYQDLGIDLPRVSQDQARVGTAVPSLAEARPGDLVCFGTPADHIGIYIGDHKMIVAPKAGDVVKVEDVYRTPSSIRRILPEYSVGSASGGTASVAAASLTSPTSSSPAMAAAPAAYRALFEQAGARYGVAPDLLAAVAQTESGFNAGAVSGAGAGVCVAARRPPRGWFRRRRDHGSSVLFSSNARECRVFSSLTMSSAVPRRCGIARAGCATDRSAIERTSSTASSR